LIVILEDIMCNKKGQQVALAYHPLQVK